LPLKVGGHVPPAPMGAPPMGSNSTCYCLLWIVVRICCTTNQSVKHFICWGKYTRQYTTLNKTRQA